MSFEYNDESFSVLKRALSDDWYMTIFDNVKTVADDAFKDNHNIHELTFSNTERTIGKGAFENCSSLRIVHLGVIPEVPDYAFANCQSLEGISIVPTIRRIGDNAFLNCKKLRWVHLWNCIEYISDTAFDGCDGILCYVGKQSYAEKYCREHNIRYMTTMVDDIEDKLLREYTWLMGVDDVENYNPDENISFADRFKATLNGSSVNNCKSVPTVSSNSKCKDDSQLTDFTVSKDSEVISSECDCKDSSCESCDCKDKVQSTDFTDEEQMDCNSSVDNYKDSTQRTNITISKDTEIISSIEICENGEIVRMGNGQSENGGIEDELEQSPTEICKNEVQLTDFTIDKDIEVDSSDEKCEDIPEQTFDTVYEDDEIESSLEDYEDSHNDSLLEDYEDEEDVSLFEDYEDDNIETYDEDVIEIRGIEPYFCSDIDKNDEHLIEISFAPMSETDDISEIEPYVEPTMALDCEDEEESVRNIVNEPYSDETSMDSGVEIKNELTADNEDELYCNSNLTIAEELGNELTADNEDELYCNSNLTIAEELGSESDSHTARDKTVLTFNNVNGTEEHIIAKPVKGSDNNVEIGGKVTEDGSPSSIISILNEDNKITEVAETENNCNLNSDSTLVNEMGVNEMKKSEKKDKRFIETYDQLVLVEDLNGNVLTDVQVKPVEQPNLNCYKNSDETGVYYITPDTKRSEFNSNSNIKELRVVEGVTEIPQWVAAYCLNLTTLVLAPSVKKIGAYAFYGSSNLKCLIDNGCDTLTMEVGRDAFNGCKFRMGSTEK